MSYCIIVMWVLLIIGVALMDLGCNIAECEQKESRLDCFERKLGEIKELIENLGSSDG